VLFHVPDVSVAVTLCSFFGAAAFSNACISVLELWKVFIFVLSPIKSWWLKEWGQNALGRWACVGAVVAGIVHAIWLLICAFVFIPIGFLLSARKLKYMWHAVAYWAYIVTACLNGVWYVYSEHLSEGATAVVVLIMAVVLLGWVRLAGDIEEKCNIIILSPSHIMAMHKDGHGLLCFFSFCFLKFVAGLCLGLIGLIVGWIVDRRSGQHTRPGGPLTAGV
jgi:hypothetical protein